MSAHWGHKVTVHIYVPGDIATAADVSDNVVEDINPQDDPRIAFMGVSIDDVQDEPMDQVAS